MEATLAAAKPQWARVCVLEVCTARPCVRRCVRVEHQRLACVAQYTGIVKRSVFFPRKGFWRTSYRLVFSSASVYTWHRENTWVGSRRDGTRTHES